MYFSCFSFLPCWLAESSWSSSTCWVPCYGPQRRSYVYFTSKKHVRGVLWGPCSNHTAHRCRACGKWETFVPMLTTAHPTGCLVKTVSDRQSTCSLGSQIPWEPQFTNTQELLISTRRRASKHPAGSPLPWKYREEQSQGSQSVGCGGERSLTLESSVVPRALGSL